MCWILNSPYDLSCTLRCGSIFLCEVYDTITVHQTIVCSHHVHQKTTSSPSNHDKKCNECERFQPQLQHSYPICPHLKISRLPTFWAVKTAVIQCPCGWHLRYSLTANLAYNGVLHGFPNPAWKSLRSLEQLTENQH